MPVSTDKLTYCDMTQRTRTHRCSCGGVLTVAWCPQRSAYILRCGRDITHDEVVPIDNSAEVAEIRSKLGRNKELQTLVGKEQANKLARYENVTTLTRPQAEEIVRAIWPTAPRVEVQKAVILCHQYNLNPLMKHVFLVPFTSRKTGETTWSMVLGIKATRIIASRSGRYGYIDGTPRLMTEDEQKTTFGQVQDDRIWAITKVRDAFGNEAPGYGFWLKADSPHGTDKGNTPFNMAFIRSERAALERLFPDAIPQGVDVVDENYVPPVPPNGANSETGEIIEGVPPATQPGVPATPAQLRHLYALVGEKGLLEEVRHYIADVYHKDNSTLLTVREVMDLIRVIEHGEMAKKSPEEAEESIIEAALKAGAQIVSETKTLI